MKRLHINRNRFLGRLDELATIGALEDGGVCRLAFTTENLKGRRYIQRVLESFGAEIRIDAIGNLFGIIDTGRPGPTVMTGSHTDTVGAGGAFDGSLGVIAAIEVAECLTEKPDLGAGRLIVADFVNEEGVRFMPDMMGSLYMRGDLSLEDIRSIKDSDGTTIGEEMDRLDFAGPDSMPISAVDTFVELHIEQGPVLETAAHTVGIVTGVQGLKWFEITCSGASNHAGTTPMAGRRDAIRTAATLIDDLYGLPEEINGLRMTVGAFRARPGLINVIADRVVFSVDIRHTDPEKLKQAEQDVRSRVASAGQGHSVEVHMRELADAEPVSFDPRVTKTVARAADELEVSSLRMISGAGHDAQILAGALPAGMIFIPSRDGISHSPAEFSEPEHLVAGAEVLMGSIVRLMQG